MEAEGRIAFAVGALLGVAGGVVIGYKWASRKLGSEFEERLERETAELRTFYKKVPGNKYATPQEAVKDLVQEAVKDLVQEAGEASQAMSEYQGSDGSTQYHKVTRPVEEEPLIDIPEVEVDKNLFKPTPDPDKPYIISQEDYMQGDPGYEQVTVTYYQQDNVLADEKDDQIENVEKSIGLDCLVSFGTGSSDPNTVHVRNEALRLDFEIVRHEGSFAKEVLGVDEPMEAPKKSARQRRETGE